MEKENQLVVLWNDGKYTRGLLSRLGGGGVKAIFITVKTSPPTP